MDDLYRVLTTILADELQTDIPPLRPDTVLDDLPGWDSVSLAGVLLAIEERFKVNAVRRDATATTGADLARLSQPG